MVIDRKPPRRKEMHSICRAAIAASCLIAAGCSSIDVISKKQMETESRLEQLLQTSSVQGRQMAEISRDLQELKTRLADQEKSLASLKTAQEVISARVPASTPEPTNTASGETSKATIQVVNPEPEKQERETRDQEAYMKAFGIFSANRYPEAIAAFTDFIGRFPGSEYAGNAQYWIGECHYTQKDFDKALRAFQTVVEKYPKGKKVPDAMLKVAFSQISLREDASARSTLQKLIETYPKSPAAAKAKERLNRLQP